MRPQPVLRRAPFALGLTALTAPLALAQRVPALPASSDEAPARATIVPAGTAPAPEVSAALHWADWSGDGLLDAWAVQPDGSGLLLENDGTGSFLDRTASAGFADVRGVHAAAWGDVDGDGLLDLYLASWTGESRLFVQATEGDFVDVTGASELDANDHPVEAGWIDFDGDGTLDLHLVTQTEDLLYRGVGDARYARVDIGLLAKVLGGAAVGVPPSPGASDAADVPARPPAPATLNGTFGSAAIPGGTYANGVASLTCAGSVEDQAGTGCIPASSTPTLGHLYPLSSNLFVEAASGRVGIGTTTPSARLHVAGDMRATRGVFTTPTGTPPMSVSSITKVNNLNVDLIDGLSSEAFRQTGVAINGFDILDATITNADVSATAAIAGTKIQPDFGTQQVRAATTADTASFEHLASGASSAVRGAQPNLDNYGYLAHQGSTTLEGLANPPAWNGFEIGVAGLSVGSSVTDNYGVIGHSNHVAIRAENANLPQQNFAELGLDGVGIRARGTSLAADFEARVDINSLTAALDVTSTGGGSRAVTIENSGGGSALSVLSTGLGSTNTNTCLNVNTQNRGIAALIQSSSLTAINPTLRVIGGSSGTNQDMAHFRHDGTSTGSAVKVEVTSSSSLANGIEVTTSGTGDASLFTAQNGLAGDFDRITNGGSILQARNGADVEFRVDSSGDVFCDLAFNGGGADYAEWLEQLDPTEDLQPGDVVGVFGGRVTKDLDGAETVLVLSTNPVLVGNSAGAETGAREGHVVVAFLGQVPVRCRGAVRAGDFLIPSDLHDGTAIAIAPADLPDSDIERVIGRAWGSKDARGIETVNAAIGLDRGAIAAAALRAVRAELDSMLGALEHLGARLDALESAR